MAAEIIKGRFASAPLLTPERYSKDRLMEANFAAEFFAQIIANGDAHRALDDARKWLSGKPLQAYHNGLPVDDGTEFGGAS
jgi:hypothetical protein